uniref:Secreted protein n=1 Tax=Amphiprion ocellaris TaxID=80972 RepID=A0AAQ5YM76_AMPOC
MDWPPVRCPFMARCCSFTRVLTTRARKCSSSAACFCLFSLRRNSDSCLGKFHNQTLRNETLSGKCGSLRGTYGVLWFHCFHLQ